MSKSASLPVILEQAARGRRLSDADARALLGVDSVAVLGAAARRRRDRSHGELITWSPKVFIALTELCRDVCHYCTFAKTPKRVDAPFMTMDAVLEIARAGVDAGCTEALFTLGDKPELRYREAAAWLADNGYSDTVDYLAHAARTVLEETGLLPHLNPGVLTAGDYAALKPVSASMGMMLESTSDRLCRRGGAHFGSPDKEPAVRIESINAAGASGVPFTSGILIGIGETREERIDALLALRDSAEQYGHLQEIIVQNFRAKPGTRMAEAAEPDLTDHCWSIAIARLILPPEVSVQAPPNLADDHSDALDAMIDAGINDFGGVSPVTPDHVNPEKPWPSIAKLDAAADRSGKALAARLPVYPRYMDQVLQLKASRAPARVQWLHEDLVVATRKLGDASGLARQDHWSPGLAVALPQDIVARITHPSVHRIDPQISKAIEQLVVDDRADEKQIARLLEARGSGFSAVCQSADELRRDTVGDRVSYVVNRNINYTNICIYKCRFCAYSKGSTADDLRGKPYDLDLEEIARRTTEAWDRGATEVCLQGGIHPGYTGRHYLDVVRTVREAAPEIHIHAFTPLEITQGAETLGLSTAEFLQQLTHAGLDTLPGTSAEILDDAVRARICPDKLSTSQWLDVMRIAHQQGLRSTATIMFGHLEQAIHQARHLLRVRELAKETGGFTEFVPLPFVHMEAPMYRRGESRRGPVFREAVLIHAVARLVLNSSIPNIQASWVKLGPDGVRAVLKAGANDIGGTLMNESITRAAGADHGQEFAPQRMRTLIESAGRKPWQRTTLYAPADASRVELAGDAPALTPLDSGIRISP